MTTSDRVLDNESIRRPGLELLLLEGCALWMPAATRRDKRDAEGRVTTITYAPNAMLESSRDQDGFGADYRYDYDSSKKQFYSRERKSGNVVTETWTDSDDELVRRDFNEGTVAAIRCDGNDRIVTDGNGNTTRIRYDALRRTTGITFCGGPCGVGPS